MDEREIPEYSVSELESRAADILRQSQGLCNHEHIDIEFIAENDHGLEIVTIPKLTELFSVEGILWKTEEGEYKIVMDKDLMDYNLTRARFTVAEEIAHFLLHKEFFGEARDIETAVHYHCGITNHSNADRNAKWLAAALLMPPDRVQRHARQYYAAMVAAAGFSDPDGVMTRLTSVLARTYQVSVQAMNIRLNNWPVSLAPKIDEALKKRLPNID
jgi:hypothetical protein